MKRTGFTTFILLLAISLIISACGQNSGGSAPQQPGSGEASETPAATALERIQASGKLRLGTSADYPPYEFHKLIGGKDTIVGFDIEIAKEIAADLGVELEIQDMAFEGLLTALQTGNVDIVLAGMTPDDERRQSVDFSEEYYMAIQKVIVRAEDKDKYKTVTDLKGAKVGAQLGAIQENIVKQQMPESVLRALAKLPDLILDLKTKNVEAVVVEEPVALAYVAANPELAISEIALEQDEAASAAAMRKNSPELVEAVNATLERLHAEGKIDQFVLDATNAME